MSVKMKKNKIRQALNKGNGIVRLVPAWVPRSFLVPGGRLKLHPDDLYALGGHRGGIDESWLASTTNAQNGPNTPADEGLSYIVCDDGEKVLLKEAIELMGEAFLGSTVMEKFGGWMVLNKFFDNQGPIPLHMHQMEEHARKVGQSGKPEAYYFPPQLNMKRNHFPYTFFGLEPGTTKKQVKQCLEAWDQGDNKILYLTKAYKLQPGTGWNVPAGVLHAPGSLVTYEPQRPFDIYGMFQSLVEDRIVPRDLLVKDVPESQHYDYDYLVSMLDWEQNTDPYFGHNHFVEPKPVRAEVQMRSERYIENWVVYGSKDFSAKELTVLPGKSVTVSDDSAYGTIAVQGQGAIGVLEVETPTMIRLGDFTKDEFFVTMQAAKQGVVITNTSDIENLVMLKHFGPEL